MPVGATIGLGLGSAAAGAIGAHLGGKSQVRAAEIGARSSEAGAREQIRYLEQKDAEAKRQFDMQQALAQRDFQLREGRLAPYRQIGEQATNMLFGRQSSPAQAIGVNQAPKPVASNPSMPADVGGALSLGRGPQPPAATNYERQVFDPSTGRLVPLSSLTLGNVVSPRTGGR